MKCLVSRQITELAYPVRFMYCEIPDHPADSGWRFLSGFEDEAYINNPDNIVVCGISEIAEIDPAVLPLLDYQAGSAFERLASKECFTPVL